jgi:hypothetical protein
MKNYTTKKFTLATLLMFATPVAVVVPALSIQTIHAQSVETSCITEKLDEFFCLGQGYAMELSEKMTAFVSPADKRPYAAHVDDFEQCYLAAKRDLLIPMDTLLASVAKESADYKPVLQTHTVLHKMGHIMDFIQKTLRANQGVTNPTALGKKLIAMKATAREKLQEVFVALAVLSETMKTTPGYYELALKVTALQVELRELLKDEGMSMAQQFKMLGVIKQRCKQ